MSTPSDQELDALRAAFNQAPPVANTEHCPSPQLILDAAAGDASAEQRDLVLDHLATCVTCRYAWQIAADLTPRRASGTVVSLTERVSRRSRALPALAAAATVVAAVGLTVLVSNQYNPAPVYRGAPASQAMIPTVQSVGSAWRFSWQAPTAQTVDSYRLSIVGEDLTVLFSVEQAVSDGAPAAIRVDDARLRELVGESPFYWQLEATLVDGSSIESATRRGQIGLKSFSVPDAQ